MGYLFGHPDIDVLDANHVYSLNFDPANSFANKAGSGVITNVGTADGAGKNGRGRVFDGTNYLNADVAAGSVDVAKGAISIWYTMADGAYWSDSLLYWMAEIWLDDNNRIWISKTGGNRMSCRFEGNNAPRVRTIDVSGRSDTNWHNLLVAWDSSANLSMFEDGAIADTPIGILSAWTGSPTVFKIGAKGTGGADRWKGSLDQIDLWAGAVPDLAAAAAIWNSGNGRFYHIAPSAHIL